MGWLIKKNPVLGIWQAKIIYLYGATALVLALTRSFPCPGIGLRPIRLALFFFFFFLKSLGFSNLGWSKANGW